MLLAASAVFFSAAGAALPDPFLGAEFMRLLLANDTVWSWNGRTRGAFAGNGTYTAERGVCGGHALKEVPEGLYRGALDGTAYLDLGGVNVSGDVFSDGCGVLYSGEPEYLESGGGRLWAAGGGVSLTVGVGCTTRVVNGTWDNLDGEKPGGGRHKEYLLPVEEETVVWAGDAVCYNQTKVHGAGGYPISADSVRVLVVNCTLGNGSAAGLRLRHVCRGFVLLDSAYSVMGFRVGCDEESIRTLVWDRCCDSRCFGIEDPERMAACNAMCENVAEEIAHNGCQPRKSPKAVCPTPPSGVYGRPGDGSSVYFIELPRFDEDYCKRFCVEEWDPSDMCLNNRVSLASGESYECAQGRDYALDIPRNVSCNGSFYREGPYVRGSFAISSEPDTTSAVVVGGIPCRLDAFVPRHVLYRMAGATGPPIRGYSLLEHDYLLNETHNDTGYFDFALLEAVPDGAPPTVGDGLIIAPRRVNGSVTVDFVREGGLGDFTAYVLDVGDRFNAPKGADCGLVAGCPYGLVCLDGFCMDPLRTGAVGLRLGECLTEAADTDIALSAPAAASPGENVTLTLGLTCDDAPVGGAAVAAGCSNGFSANASTDASGTAAFSFTMGSDTAVCTAKYGGDFRHAPSRAVKAVRSSAAFSWGTLVLFLGLLALLAAAYSVASGGYRLNDFYEALKGLLE
jgi:hypothetical protein